MVMWWGQRWAWARTVGGFSGKGLIIFIDPSGEGWLKVVESGLEWINSPPAHGHAFYTPPAPLRR